MRKKYDIIINTLFRSDNAFSSVSLSFAKEMAKTHRVFYINHPYSVKDIWDLRTNKKLRERLPTILRGGVYYEKLKEIPENFVVATPPPTIPINFLSNNSIYETLYQYNKRVMLRTVKKVIADYNIKDYIYMTCYDPFFIPVLPKEMGAALNIYQCIDDISTEAYVAKHGVRLEEQAARESDLTLVTSTNLCRFYKQFQPETQIMHNAVDISIFKNLYYRNDIERPAEIKDIKTKIIGFTGNLDNVRLDYQLMRRLAEGHPDKTLLLVGPINSPEVYTEGLDKMPNVILTGAKSIYEVANYLKFMDVAILPSLLNKMSRSVYPLKINEYLAAGKSAIATSFSDDIRSFQPHIRIADSHDHFVQLIDEAIDDYPEYKVRQRMAIGESNTWGDRVREFWEIVDAHLEKKKPKKEVLV
ncbi:MAG: glycosyltransferase [Saprospiraceae bacterium]|nr:glycosyltransferase [Saprospiraceae bacterium]